MKAAVVTNECQRGVIGDLALWRALADAAQPMIPVLAKLLDRARSANAPVVHCMAVRREDLRGASRNAPLFDVANRRGGLTAGTPAAALVEELGPHPNDIVCEKTHGLASLRTTGVDNALRNLGVDAIVLCGVSVNVAIPTLAFEAVNLGYRVMIPRDAIAGVPPSYADDVIENTLKLVAEIVTAEDVTRTLG